MFEVLVYMFENYFSQHNLPESEVMAEELFAAGFEKMDITGAVKWFHEMKTNLDNPPALYSHAETGVRIFDKQEKDKIHTEAFSFVLFLQQAGVINDVERDLIVDRAMALVQEQINLEEVRWITMIALWSTGREKDYLFVEDALFNPRGMTLH
jgi:Smg protein